jgi:hypothetical protein
MVGAARTASFGNALAAEPIEKRNRSCQNEVALDKRATSDEDPPDSEGGAR